MKKLTVLLFFLAATLSRAEDAPVSESRFIVGFGGGYEAGNGLRLGMKWGPDAVELGLGLLYDAQNAELKYSTGLRYLHDLYNGRLNNTYVWTGAGIMGHQRTGDAGYLASAGAGLGISLHFGLPFHINFDSGWHVYYDGDISYHEIQVGPTINGDLVYEW